MPRTATTETGKRTVTSRDVSIVRAGPLLQEDLDEAADGYNFDAFSDIDSDPSSEPARKKTRLNRNRLTMESRSLREQRRKRRSTSPSNLAV